MANLKLTAREISWLKQFIQRMTAPDKPRRQKPRTLESRWLKDAAAVIREPGRPD